MVALLKNFLCNDIVDQISISKTRRAIERTLTESAFESSLSLPSFNWLAKPDITELSRSLVGGTDKLRKFVEHFV